MNPNTSKLTTLLGTASFLTMANAIAAQAQQVAQAQMAQTQEQVPEQVLITGSLIRGTVAVGVPVTNLGSQDFRTTGALSTSDLFRSIPQFNVGVGGGAGTIAAGRAEGGTRVNLRQLDTGTAPRNLMMIDGVRFPPQDQGLCQIEPDIIPVVAIDRIDLLLDGASATYGSDAIGGVINVILKRAYDGAITQGGYKTGAGGNNQYFGSQLWGRTWDGGDITLSFEWRNIHPTNGKVNNRYTFDFSPFGLDNRTPLASSIPGTISTGGTISNDNTNYPSANGNNCLNCWAIPDRTGLPFAGGATGIGPTAPFSASTLNWTTFNVAANHNPTAGPGAVDLAGTRNEFNPYSIVDYSAGLQFSGSAITVDQRLTKNISFYGEGLYGMRRAQVLNQENNNQLNSIAVPTSNPYYPTGGAPTNLRVAYHMSIESPSRSSAYELGQRYLGGLNIDLPREWGAQVYYSETRDSNALNLTGRVNKAAVSAALGWTLAAQPASGTKPGIASFVKPGNVPYLNLFCDPRTIQCNSPTTMAYINFYSQSSEAYWVNEKAIKADGPLFDLPGGAVKAAIGASYVSNHYILTQVTESQNSTLVDVLTDPQSRSLWAVYGQLNVPVFSDMNAIPLVRKLDFEASWRHDQYSDFGGTSNAKIGFNWNPIDDLTFRGGWGTSFRAPNFGENSLLSNSAWNGFGLPAAVFSNNNKIDISCVNGAPVAGSGSQKLFNAGFKCAGQPGYVQPAGLSFNGGAKSPNVAGWREFFNTDGQALHPEQALNWSAGFDYAPTNFLKGLDLQATWYSIKITSVLVGFGNPTTGRFNDPALGFAFIVPSDLRDPITHNQLCAGMDATPQLCAPFQNMIAKAIAHPLNTVPSSAQTLIYWLNDGGVFNKGWQRNEGIDYQASYDWDSGDFGAFNVGVTGTYYIHQITVKIPGDPGSGGQPVDAYDDSIAAVANVQQLGVSSTVRPRSLYRARLGWSSDHWTATGFMNYSGHFYHTQAAPPDVNNQCLTAGGTIGGGSNQCAISNYNNIVPSYYTFDLSLGYDTGDVPVNDYLKNISIQLTVDNVMDRTPPFEYRISTGGGNPSAFNILQNIYGRMVGVRVTKTW
jgi:outer membrane receptor protein involved in Fe transport